MVTPEEIERVDVLYGPFSAAYPGNSVGAVVDYVTRMPRQFEAHGKLTTVYHPFNLYATDGTFGAKQASVSAGNRNGDWSWFFNVNRSDSDGHPQTFATRVVATGVPGAAGTPVTGAVAGLNRTNQPWWLLGTGTQYDSQQDHLKAKIAYDITPALRASYTIGWWDNNSQGNVATYLRDAAGNPVYSGNVNIDGRSFTLLPSDFAPTRESLTHFMQGLSLKSHGRGEWDWELAASSYDYHRDTLRVSHHRAARGGRRRRRPDRGHERHGLDHAGGQGHLAPAGLDGTHVVDFGLQRDAYQLRSIENATGDWIVGSAGARNLAFVGDAMLHSLYAQDTWKLRAAMEDGAGRAAGTLESVQRPDLERHAPPSRIRSAARPTCRPRRRSPTRRASNGC